MRTRFLVASILALTLLSGKAYAETRLYHLRVTLPNGERYETISSFDPINYCHANGGVTARIRNIYLVYSPQMKVKALRTWIEPGPNLARRWLDILRTNGMLASRNHKKLPKAEPPGIYGMMTPE